MKPNYISPQSITAVCFLPAIMAFCPNLSAQEVRAKLEGSGAEQDVTFAFTETYTDYALKPRDEEGKIISGDLVDENEWSTEKYKGEDLIEESSNSEYGVKQVTEKISNKELLDALNDEELIPEDISGWSVKFVTPGDDDDAEHGRFYAVKSGYQPVDLSEIISMEGSGEAESESEKWSSKTTYKNDDSTTKETWSYSSKLMTNLFIGFSFSDNSFLFLDGIFNESWSMKSFGTGENQYLQFAPGAAKLDNASGTSRSVEGDQFVDEWDYESVIKGTMSLSAGKLFQNINVPYPDFEPNAGDDEYDEDD